MKIKFCILVLCVAAAFARAQTTNLTSLLQQGLIEEQANRNLDAAIADYQTLAAQFDKDRQLAATAIFRLGECYREEGLTNEAALQYQRIVREFPDQKTLATLSQQDLAGMGIFQSAIGQIAGNPTAPVAASTDAAVLANQISGIESLKSDPEEEARAVLAIFPDDAAVLQKMLFQLPKLQQQEAALKANTQSSLNVVAIGSDGDVDQREFDARLRELLDSHSTNLLASADKELQRQITWIQEQVNFILDVQKARLKVLQAAGAQTAQETAQSSAPNDAEAQEIQRIQEMIQNSPDLINAPDSNGNLPLEKAARNGWLKVAAFLLDHGADVNTRGGSALFDATQAGNRTMVEFLLAHGADVNDINNSQNGTPLDLAVQDGFEAVTEALLANKADVNARDSQGDTPLSAAAEAGRTNIIQILLAAGADVNVANNQGRTPLSFAAEAGSPETVKVLLAAKADPNAGTMDAPLLCAVDQNSLPSAELLLQADANPNVDVLMHCPQGSYGSQWHSEYSATLRTATPLWLAIQKHQLPMVQLLLKYKANTDLQISEPPPVIFWSLSETNILSALLDAGANPNLTNNDGRTPLSVAAEKDSLESVKLLLAAKADPNGGTCDAPLLAAINKNDLTSAESLLRAGANPNSKGNAQGWEFRTDRYGQATPLWTAVSMNQLPMVQLLLKYKADPNDSQTDGYPVIFKALFDSDINILEALLDAGANVESTGKGDPSYPDHTWTLLGDAVYDNNASAVEILLKDGANPNLHGPDGDAPLNTAASAVADKSIFKWLLDYKADPNVRGLNGETPLKVLEQIESGGVLYSKGVIGSEQKTLAASLADLLRQHGALENPPDWSRISVSRPSGGDLAAVFDKGTNDWNQFSLLELILKIGVSAKPLMFPDFSHIVIVRPNPDGTVSKRIEVNLLNSTNSVDCSKDIPLKFGDTVEIPEREHTLAERDDWTRNQLEKIVWYLRDHVGDAKLIVTGGQTIQLPLKNFEPVDCYIGEVLRSSIAQNVLTSYSDLSRVKVKRRDSKTGKKSEWILDCSRINQSSSYPFRDAPDLWLRDGDVIEVPEKP